MGSDVRVRANEVLEHNDWKESSLFALENQSTTNAWRTLPARHFIINLIQVLLWSAANRPINNQYNSWFLKRLHHAENLLQILSEPNWTLSSDQVENGLKKLSSILQEDNLINRKSYLSDSIEKLSRYHFKVFDKSWSNLRPVGSSRLGVGPTPKKLYFALGHHIGIGDEMIFSYVVDALHKKYPNASIELWSHNKDLWNWSNYVDAHYVENDVLTPFLRAHDIIKEDPDALIVFCDFASDKIYRILETVPEFERFVYIDLGSRLIRSVNQKEWTIFEYIHEGDDTTIYGMLEELASSVGLSVDAKTPIIDKTLKPIKEQAPLSIFLNPHSSKEKAAVPATWWVRMLSYLGKYIEINASISYGINEENFLFAREIQEGLEGLSIQSTILDKLSIPQLLNKAMSSDIVIGLDTFTAHINTLKASRCVTVFFGSSGDCWSVPSSFVFNAQITDDADYAGELARLLVCMPSDPQITDRLCRIWANTEKLLASLRVDTQCDRIVNLTDEILSDVQEFFAFDNKKVATFFDYPIEYIASIKDILMNEKSGEGIDDMQKLSCDSAMRTWLNSNFCRYAAYLAHH